VIDLKSAIDIVDEATKTVSKKSKTLKLEDSIGYICAKDINSTIPLPRFDNSAMDGYAVCGRLDSYKVVSKIFAGEDSDIRLKDGEAVRIFTGAKVPQTAQAVIPQERVEVKDDGTITPLFPFQDGANIRKTGEDVKLDKTILKRGEQLNSSHIALLASQGIEEIEVFDRPKVAIFASGNELKLLGEELKEGEIYNSNAPYLMARSKELGCECVFLGKCGDSIESIVKLITKADDYDLIITSGGVSVGEADFTKEAFNQLGMKRLFNKVAIKPGKPTTFGTLNKTFVLNLPGNPLACALNFEIFGKLLIKKISQISTPYQNFIRIKIDEDLKVKGKVSTVIPGFFNGDSFSPFKNYSPGSVNTLNFCNGMIIIDSKKESLKKGEIVKFIPINWDFLSKRKINFIS